MSEKEMLPVVASFSRPKHIDNVIRPQDYIRHHMASANLGIEAFYTKLEREASDGILLTKQSVALEYRKTLKVKRFKIYARPEGSKVEIYKNILAEMHEVSETREASIKVSRSNEVDLVVQILVAVSTVLLILSATFVTTLTMEQLPNVTLPAFLTIFVGASAGLIAFLRVPD